MSDRFSELMKVFDGKDSSIKMVAEQLITEMVFLENQLDSLRKLPFIKVHPEFPEIQKPTHAAKQYKELLQQYTNIVKVLCKTAGDDGDGEESPLRKWAANRNV